MIIFRQFVFPRHKVVFNHRKTIFYSATSRVNVIRFWRLERFSKLYDEDNAFYSKYLQISYILYISSYFQIRFHISLFRMDLPWNRRRHRPARADSRCDLAGRQEAKTIPIATSASKTGPENGRKTGLFSGKEIQINLVNNLGLFLDMLQMRSGLFFILDIIDPFFSICISFSKKKLRLLKSPFIF